MSNPFHYSGFDFLILHPNELKDVYRFIESGLQKIQEKARLEWDVMILPQMVSINQATLTMMSREDKYAGFVITRSRFMGMPNKHYYEITASYVEPWCHKEGLDGVKAIIEFATDFGQKLKCSRLLVTGAREGWVRRLSKEGFTFLEASVVKEI